MIRHRPHRDSTLTLDALQLGEFLSRLGSKTPAPGGGAAAAVAASTGASLARMVVQYSIGRKSLAEHEPILQHADATLLRASDIMLTLAQEDADAYEWVNQLLRLEESDPRRVRELSDAVQTATRIPLALVAACTDLLRLFEKLVGRTNPHLSSDLAIAAVLVESAARASRWNIAANAPLLARLSLETNALHEADALLEDARRLRDAVEASCR